MTYFSERIIFREVVFMIQFSSQVSNHNAGFCHWVSILWHLWVLNCGYWSCTVTPHQSHGLSDLKKIRKYEDVHMMRKYFKLETSPTPIEVSAKIVYILQHHRSKIPSIIFITKFRRAFVAKLIFQSLSHSCTVLKSKVVPFSPGASNT